MKCEKKEKMCIVLKQGVGGGIKFLICRGCIHYRA
jgi:hypothetical protein